MSEAWRKYAHATAGEHFAWFCETYCVQSIDRWDGKPLKLEDWQREFFDELLTVDADGHPYWRTAALIMPRKNSKTTMLSALAMYRLLMTDGKPSILLAASSDGQAKHLFNAAASFVMKADILSDEVHIRDYVGEISRKDGGGMIQRVASDYRRLHGANPSLVLADELAQWTQPNLRKSWAALTTASGARKEAQTIAITTAGEIIHRHDSILGQILDDGLAVGEIEGALPGRRVIRDHDSKTLIYEYASAMPDADPQTARELHASIRTMERDGAPEEDVEAARRVFDDECERLYEAWKPANPASWIDKEYLLAQALTPALSREDVLQLHANVWTESYGAWVTRDEWLEVASDERLEDGDIITLGFDGSETDDATALVAVRKSDGLIQPLGVWQRPEGVKDWRVPRLEVREAIDSAFTMYNVALMLCDRPFWQSEIDEWASEYPKRVMEFRTAHTTKMGAAIERFATDMANGAVVHTGDETLTIHMLNAQVSKASTGGFRLTKPGNDNSKKIDAAVAAVIAWEARAYCIEHNLGNPKPRGQLIAF